MKKKFSLILLAVLLVLVMATCVACGDNDTPDTPTSYTVTIDLQDGSTPTTQTVAAGGVATLPNVDNTAYKTFRGWFTSPDGTGLWSKNTPINADITIYACWNQLTAKVTFYPNYEGGGKSTSKQLPLGEAVAFPDDPTREYWIFDGWYTDEAATTKYDNSPLTGELKLYAGWTSDPSHTHDYKMEVIDPTCEERGCDLYTCYCGASYEDNILPALGHNLAFDNDDYFGMVACSNEGCDLAERIDSERIYDDVFVYTFDETRQAEIDALYQTILTTLEEADAYDGTLHVYDGDKTTEYYLANQAFEELFDAFYEEVTYVIEQYQYAYVFYCVDEDEHTDAYETVSEYRINMVSDFYSLYRLIYETQFREFFFDKIEGGWTDEDIAQALTMSDTYGGEEYAAINTRISEIEVEFREIEDPAGDRNMPKLYKEFVDLQNQLAVLAGYENYPEYAYANVYDRDYSPEDVAEMRNYVKTHLKDVFEVIDNGNTAAGAISLSKLPEAKAYYEALMSQSIFKSKLTTDLVKEYFKVMNSSAGEQDIDFLYHANELFKNGNYFTGKYQGAFNYWISAQETSILYFGPGSYSGAFTFVHEFGHYYADKYTNGISMSYDLAETHSQGDEMLFLSFIEDHLPNSVLREMYSKVYYENLYNMFAIIMLATAVDEFEYCVYTDTAPDGSPKKYSATNYNSLFIEIMESYGIYGKLNSAYWRYVVIEAPCYYISYAMSALPCVELLTVAETEGFEVAQAKYLKLYTFTDDPANVEVDEYGDKTITIGYGETLEYIGLHSIFDEDMYKALNTYFCETEKDFSYPDAE